MRRPRWVARLGRLQGPARLLVPVLIGAVALTAALLYPRSDVHGSVHTGPEGLDHVRPVVLDFRPTIGWGPHHRTIVLLVRPHRPCSVRIGPVTSTAPGRIEVSATEQGTHCGGARHIERFFLPLPTLPDSRHFVHVDVNSELLWLRWTATPPSHTHRSSNA